MPDIAEIVKLGANAWLYLPFAVLLGALHALEPGHAKSVMAAYIVAIRGSARQAGLLGLSAAVGHTVVVWILAILGLALGSQYIVAQAEPWLWLLSGVLVILLAVRMFWFLRGHGDRHHHHDHHHHHHSHHHDHPHEHRHEPMPVRNSDIVWFGFSGGLLPCPSAIAVLLVCVQIKAFALGVAMVAAFSVGLAATLIAVGVAAAWGAGKASERWPWFDRIADRVPYASAGLMLVIGLVMAATGIGSLHAGSLRK